MSDDEGGDSSKFRGPGRAAPYALSRLSAPISLVDSAREIERADQWIASITNAKLDAIASQVRALREQAAAVLREAQVNAELHRVEARFTRHPGETYHLYDRGNGARYWSLLSPADWRGAPPHPFLGSYRLEVDHSWTPVERVPAEASATGRVNEWLRNPLAGD